MARKSYTEEDRARVRQALLDTGLEMAVRMGLGGLHLAELTRAVGISKPYFYTFFDSLEDFSLQLMEEQRGRLLRLLEHRQPFESEEHMKHWLLRVAVNESRKLLRSFWRRHAVPLDEWRDAPVFQDPAQSELFQAVMALDAKYRLTIYLYYYEGCSVSEPAAALRAKPSTVQTWLQRARARLRRTLSEEEEGEGPEHVRPQIVP